MHHWRTMMHPGNYTNITQIIPQQFSLCNFVCSLKFRRVTIRGAQPSARKFASAGALRGSLRGLCGVSPRALRGLCGVLRGSIGPLGTVEETHTHNTHTQRECVCVCNCELHSNNILLLCVWPFFFSELKAPGLTGNKTSHRKITMTTVAASGLATIPLQKSQGFSLPTARKISLAACDCWG